MAGKKRNTPEPTPGPNARQFYSQALREAEQLLLAQAKEVDGLDQEIALFRVKLRQSLTQEPGDYERLLKVANFLVKALSTRYRISRQGEEDLYQSVLGVLKGIGGVLFPEGLEEGHG